MAEAHSNRFETNTDQEHLESQVPPAEPGGYFMELKNADGIKSLGVFVEMAFEMI